MRHPDTKHFCSFENCGAAFSRPDSLKAHLRLHSGERPFVCCYDDCNKSYTRSDHLKRHQDTHGSSFSCTFEGCSAVLKTKSTLKKHIGYHHHGKRQKAYKCSDCNKQFNKHSWLRMHMFKHTGIKPYLCPEENCLKRFLCPSKLRLHMKLHEGYVCTKPNCKKIFPTWTLYVRHFKVAHPKVYKCSSCDKEFLTSFNRNAHEATHKQDQEVFACPVPNCTRYYFRKFSLSQHIKSYHEKRPFACPEKHCFRAFTTEVNLESHRAYHDPSKRKRKKRNKKTKSKITFAARLAGLKMPVNTIKESSESSSDIEIEVNLQLLRTVERMVSDVEQSICSEEILTSNKSGKLISNEVEDLFLNQEDVISNEALIANAEGKSVENTKIVKIKFDEPASVKNSANKLDSDEISEKCHWDGNENIESSALDLLEAILSFSGTSSSRES